MKKLDLFILPLMMLLCGLSLAQAPKAFKYQAIIRDNIGAPASNQGVDMRISILEYGSIIYTEEHSTTTNQFGLVNLEIGRGTVLSGTFNNIDWKSSACVIDIEVDLGSTGVYTFLGSNELLSVPYALNGGEDDDWSLDNTSGDIYRTTGNVGIGIAIPTSKLHVKDGALLFDGSVGGTPASGTGTRMMWIPQQSAFRAGRTVSSRWDDTNIGVYSVAFGYNTEASKSSAVAFGYNTVASGNSATTSGDNSKASGNISTAIGHYVEAPSYGEVALGFYNTTYTPTSTFASSATDRVLSVGIGSSSVRRNAIVVLKNGHIGIGTDAPDALLEVKEGSVLFDGTTGGVPISGGGVRFMWVPEKAAIRAGEVIANAWDNANIGSRSTAFGYNSRASGSNSTAIGNGSIASQDYATALGDLATASGYSSTALGSFSTAAGDYAATLGYYADASGYVSTALGNNTTASGSISTALGNNTTASGSSSTAMGYYTTASGVGSTALGYLATASGSASNVLGYGVMARSDRETVLGSYNATTTANNSSTSWNTNDPILIVGNGQSTSNRSNALVLLKNGNMGVGIDAPHEKLHINGKLKFGSYEILEDGGNSRIGTNSSIIPIVDNALDLGISTNRWDDVYATNGTVQTSDRRNKTNIKPIQYGIKDIMQLKPVSFQWKDKPQQGDKLGLIAQDVQTVVKEVVKDTDWEMNESGTLEKVELERLGVYYSDLIPVLIKGMQDQQTQIESLQAEIKELKSQK